VILVGPIQLRIFYSSVIFLRERRCEMQAAISALLTSTLSNSSRSPYKVIPVATGQLSGK